MNQQLTKPNLFEFSNLLRQCYLHTVVAIKRYNKLQAEIECDILERITKQPIQLETFENRSMYDLMLNTHTETLVKTVVSVENLLILLQVDYDRTHSWLPAHV